MVIPEASAAVARLTAILRWIKNKREKDRSELVVHLKKIRTFIEEISQSLQAGKVPRKQSYEMAQVITFAIDKLKGPFPTRHMETLFEKILPRIGYLMRQADIFTDGRPRPSRHAYEKEYVHPSPRGTRTSKK